MAATVPTTMAIGSTVLVLPAPSAALAPPAFFCDYPDSYDYGHGNDYGKSYGKGYDNKDYGYDHDSHYLVRRDDSKTSDYDTKTSYGSDNKSDYDTKTSYGSDNKSDYNSNSGYDTKTSYGSDNKSDYNSNSGYDTKTSYGSDNKSDYNSGYDKKSDYDTKPSYNSNYNSGYDNSYGGDYDKKSYGHGYDKKSYGGDYNSGYGSGSDYNSGYGSGSDYNSGYGSDHDSGYGYGYKDGDLKCNGHYGFFKRDHGHWVSFQCASGTVCYQTSHTVILCDYPSHGHSTYLQKRSSEPELTDPGFTYA